MRTQKRIVFWSLIALFYVVVIGWLLYTPHDHGRLLHAIPGHAGFVVFHRQADRHLPGYLENSLLRALVESAGFDVAAFADWLGQPEGRTLSGWLLEGEGALAYVVPGFMGPDEAWVLTSWLGVRKTIFARLLLGSAGIDSVRKWITYKARPVYVVELAGDDAGGMMVFFLVEGGLIGCFSKNPDFVKYLIDRYDRQPPRMVSRHEELAADAFFADSGAFGWLSSRMGRVDFVLSSLTSAGGGGAVRFAGPDVEGDLAAAPAFLDRLLGPQPHGFLHVGSDRWLTWLHGAPPSEAFSVVAFLRHRLKPASVYVTLPGEAYQGRLAGMRVPAFLVGMPLPEDGAGISFNELIDELNARWRWGLVADAAVVGGRNLVYVLEGTSEHPYSRTAYRDRVAYTVLEGNLLVCNSADALMQLVARYERGEAAAESGMTPWRAPERLWGGSSARLWYGLDEGGKTIRLLASAYALGAHGKPGNEARASRIILETRAWVDALSPLHEVALGLRREDDRLVVEWRLGRE